MPTKKRRQAALVRRLWKPMQKEMCRCLDPPLAFQRPQVETVQFLQFKAANLALHMILPLPASLFERPASTFVANMSAKLAWGSAAEAAIFRSDPSRLAIPCHRPGTLGVSVLCSCLC